MKTNKVLFVGNGINRCYNNLEISWEAILNDLKKDYNIDLKENPEKPFPLLYEQIISKIRHINIKEIDVKRNICNIMKSLPSEPLHKKIVKTGFKNIITSNYDFTLENAIEDTKHPENQGIVKEKRHNLFRVIKKGNISFWHMHGVISAPNTITLGYEHYAAYLQYMREYMFSGGNYNKKIKSLKTRIAKNKITEIFSWVDLFFTADIYFLGISLDFTEFPLWYLINERCRMKAKGLKIHNKIYYFTNKSKPGKGNIFNHKQINNNVLKENAKFDLLKANGIKIFEKESKNYEEFYLNSIKQIKNI